MTLSPVFRSPAAIRLLEQEGVWQRLRPALESQARAVHTQHAELRTLLDSRFLDVGASQPAAGGPAADATSGGSGERPGGDGATGELEFLQEYFFLILFRSLFEALGVAEQRLQFYAELNFCIKGTITAADNLFDGQSKSLLPLSRAAGYRYLSILQLMCFERLLGRTGDRALDGGILTEPQWRRVLRALLDQMADIGRLEGSEEGGVREIPRPEEMVEHVHRVRGGRLFELAFVAPKLLETGEAGRRVRRAEPALARLGTAFQIVDDLTDFEFDLDRRSHNLLVSQIRHHGTSRQRAKLVELWGGAPARPGLVESLFREPARAVLGWAYREARAAFRAFEELGFWFPARLADQVVHAIVGLEGVTRMEAIASP